MAKLPLYGTLAALVLCAPADAAIGTQPPQSSNSPSGLGDLLRQARQAMSQGRANVAVLYLKNAVALAPKNADVRLELGYAYLRSGDAASAERELRTARSSGAQDARALPILFEAMLARRENQQILDQFPAPGNDDRSPLAAATWRARALAQYELGHIDEAQQYLDTALAFNREVQTLVARARIAKDRHDTDTTLKLLNEAAAKAPNDQSVLLTKISALQSANRANEALPAADTLVNRYPDTPVSRLARASVLMQIGQDAKARGDVDAVLARWKTLPQAQYLKAMLLDRAKDPKGAWMIAQALPPEFINARPENAMMVARMAALSGHNDVAMTILSGAASRFPNVAEPRLFLASQYLREKNAQRALDTLQPLHDSTDPRVAMLLGQTYTALGQSAKATEYFDRAGDHGSDLTKRQAAIASIRAGDNEAAVRQLRDVFAKDPADQITAGMLITALVRSEDLKGADDIARRLVAAAPKSAYGPLYQGQIAIARKDYNAAIASFDRALALDPKLQIALYDRALARAGAGDAVGAGKDLDAVLARDPGNSTAMIRAAELSLRLGQDAKAEGYLKRAAASDQKSVTPSLALASYYLSRKRIKEASAVVAAARQRAPKDNNAAALQGEIQLASGQTDAALATFRPLAAALPNSPQIQLLLASALVAKKDNKGAEAAYKRSLALAPQFTIARTALVRFASDTGNTSLALATAEEGTQKDPSATSDILYATTLARLGKRDQAIMVMRQGFAKHPSVPSVIVLSQLLRQAKKAREADQVLAEWTDKHPADMAVRLELAQGLMQTNPTLSEAQFRTVLKTDPNNMIALNNLSWLLQKRDTKQALAFAERAAKLAPQTPAVLDTLGWVKWLSKDVQGALTTLQKAHDAEPQNAEIAYHLAVVQNATGRKADAKKTLAAVMASNQQFSERADAMALSGTLR
ncbi:putative PEP-CTERM system TPR-repeat lipoprotein [Rhizomicrobium palustre]|uniref:Putative PEP-CTERM system TPR-repeat lipoprotein n=1 Tax=Rhizomicrobium palustre TaxID=189966 RepID=A0A846MUN0_9PROT|nr:XrtA/PEP-CTERM system TPR-repeat protein PrsT [Rhizomicrobium palustre]NIK86717.1 putative PEP-CTERM system TPR-repeat lipoprotein [Rhizomicrobium palustre]